MAKTQQLLNGKKGPVSRIETPRLFEQPYIRPKNLLGEKIKSVNTAKKHLSELENNGLLTKVKIGKEYVWFNTELMDILSD